MVCCLVVRVFVTCMFEVSMCPARRTVNGKSMCPASRAGSNYVIVIDYAKMV